MKYLKLSPLTFIMFEIVKQSIYEQGRLETAKKGPVLYITIESQ